MEPDELIEYGAPSPTAPAPIKSLSKGQKYTLTATKILRDNNIIRVNSSDQYYYLPKDDPQSERKL